MKILALDQDLPGVADDQQAPHLQADAPRP